MVSEFSVGAYSSEFLGHTNVWFINSITLLWLGNWSFMSPLELFRRVPKDTIIQKCVFILNLVLGPSWISISPLTISAFDLNLVFCIVLYFWGAICVGFNCQTEAAIWIFFANVLISIPMIKISKEFHALCIWCPFFKC